MSLLPSIFWLSTVFLTLLCLVFLLYTIKSFVLGTILSILFIGLSYGLYFHWGSYAHLKEYYSESNRELRTKQGELRRLLTEFKKTEFKLRQRLEENPEDLEAEWRLLDVLAIKSLQNQEFELAIQYWDEALLKIPHRKDTVILRERIINLKNSLK